MKHYADSSFLVSCYVVDVHTPRAKSVLSAIGAPLAFTDLHALELQNALQLGIFRGNLTAAQSAAARANLRKDLKSGRLVQTFVQWPEVFRAATRLSQRHSRRNGTRSLDVLHVAAAKSFRARVFLSFDARQLALAAVVGLKVRIEEEGSEGKAELVGMSLDELARAGAQRMLAAALEAEVRAYVAAHGEQRAADGKALVVCNGHARPRKVTVGSGTIEVRAPRVNDQRVDDAGERQRFRSRILPPYMRRSPKVAEVLPILYLRGLSTGDFREALPVLLGADAAGLSPTTITRLTAEWEQDYTAFRQRDLRARDYVYVWVDGVHFNIRLEEERLCTLVMIGARADGTKEVIAVEDGYRESTESWLTLLRDLKRRGMQAPVVAVGDGALGFWKTVGEVWPETREQRGWFHRLGNVLDKLPKRLQSKAKRALDEIIKSSTQVDAEKAIAAFVTEYESKYPKAVASLTRDQDTLLTLYDFPAEHWLHLRTTNPVESPFSTVRLRQRVTKGAGSRTKGLVMAFKLLEMAEQRWRKLNAAHLLPLVRAEVKFVDGVQPERPDRKTLKDAA